MADYKDITTSYSRQFRRPNDARREAEREQWKADLEEVKAVGPVENEAMAAYAVAFDAEMEKHAVENVAQAGGQIVDDAINGAVTAADERLKTAAMTSEQRQARAFVDELEARGVTLGDTHFHSDDDEPASEAETAKLSAWLDEDEDTYYLLDENGAYLQDEAGNYLTADMHEDG